MDWLEGRWLGFIVSGAWRRAARRCIWDGIWRQDGDEWWRCARIGLGTESRGYLIDGVGMAVVLWDVLRPCGGHPSLAFGWGGDVM